MGEPPRAGGGGGTVWLHRCHTLLLIGFPRKDPDSTTSPLHSHNLCVCVVLSLTLSTAQNSKHSQGEPWGPQHSQHEKIPLEAALRWGTWPCSTAPLSTHSP